MEFMIPWTYPRLTVPFFIENFFLTACQIILWSAVILSPFGYASETRSHGSSWDGGVCPYLYSHRFNGYTTKGNLSVNTFKEQTNAAFSLEKCIQSCCMVEYDRSDQDGTDGSDGDCNAILMYNDKCYHVSCKSNEDCLPVKNEKSKDVTMVLVKPILDGDNDLTWSSIIHGSSSYASGGPIREPSMGNVISFRGRVRTCIVGSDSACLRGEECIPSIRRGQPSKMGFCMCPPGQQSEGCWLPADLSPKMGEDEDDEGAFDLSVAASINHESTVDPRKPSNQILDYPVETVGHGLPLINNQPLMFNAQSKPSSTTSPPPKTLEVSVMSQTVRLPENEVTLSAFVIPSEKPGEHYSYEWTLLSRPGADEVADTGTMQDKNGPNLRLRNLKEGFYSFQVVVSGPDAIGKQVANVTVLPPKRKNQPPEAKVTPLTQVVRLPNTGAVLDGSGSSDDDRIVSYHWELQQGPLGYQPHLPATSTLQLDNLTLPGNYTFKLTVVDSDDESSSAVGKIEVVKERDYPPVANAGQDVIVYLPHNAVTLYGNRSTDDRGIVSWEWTKRPGDNAVDMQNTRMPNLELSNLEEGYYTFALRVTDNSGQNSTAEVHVFVKPPTKKPPVANAGGNASISLPRTWYILDGSKSSDDVAIVDWYWEQISGPTKAVFLKLPPENKGGGSGTGAGVPSGTTSDAAGKVQNGSSLPSSVSDSKGISGVKVNATALTKGTYIFNLTVTDGDGNKATENVSITVNQPINAPPKADAGGDHTVVAGEGGPGWLIVADGHRSSDDLAIVSWKWTREPSGLAAGKVVGDSDQSPVLKVVDAVPGRYVFTLRVTDEQGAFSEDTVSIIVKPDPRLMSLVEVWLNVDAGRLTAAQLAALEARLVLLLPHPAIPRLVDLKPDSASGRTVIVFYAEEDSKASLTNSGEGVGKGTDPKTIPSQGTSAEGGLSNPSSGDGGRVLPGPLVADRLRKRLAQDRGLLELSVARVQTVVCQNTCSRHGVCEQSTRQCLCEAFWMQDPLRKFLGDGDSNCDWSILYVVVGACAMVVLTVFGGWAIACVCQHLCSFCCASRVSPAGSDGLVPTHRSRRQQRSSHRRSGKRGRGTSPRHRQQSSCSWSLCCGAGSMGGGGEGGGGHASHGKHSRYSLLGDEEGGVMGGGEEEEEEDEEEAMLHSSPMHLNKFQPSASEASNSDDVLFELRTSGGSRNNGIPGSRRIKT
ncbi:dyslexia-associated protein KIAA0319-like protein isoform X2 [Ischnura elegans]|uniref:dyslexia-associated protein KIAA0319-like protein isoform X2 n=1 Tax=Ischnura elegans TaxID=197161 RepID=UPI001ED8ABF1|nr:dyslexia-associated protein KIAA0319-like protein isoform X2 [Ischnura elegans]